MEKKLENYMHFYLGCECQVKCSEPGNVFLIGRLVEITSGSNHGDWAEILFEHVVRVHKQHYSSGYSESNMHTFFLSQDGVKPLLRPLSDITEDEATEILSDRATRCNNRTKIINGTHTVLNHAELFRNLLAKGFDLFDLIPSGLAIDKTINQDKP